MPFQIIRNDITKVRADAIVNTANPKPVIGRGTDHAVYTAAGETELLKERRKIGEMAVGEAAATKAFGLKAKYIIHTTGPKWKGGGEREMEKLASCYRKSLRLAAQLKCKSIAFPLISAGNYGFPKEKALETALTEIRSFLADEEMEVTLVVFDRTAFELSKELTDGVASYIDENYVEEKRREEYHGAARREEAYGTARREEEYFGSVPREEACGAAGHDEELLSESVDFVTGALPELDEAAFQMPQMPNAAPSEAKTEIAEEGFAAANRPMQSAAPSAAKPSMQAISADTAPAKPRGKAKGRKLQDLIGQTQESFQESLLRRIDEKGYTDVEVYKKANLDRKLFSKIRSNPAYQPKKRTAVALALALELNMDETIDLIGRAGYAFSPASKADLIIRYCIENNIYDLIRINCILYDYDQPQLGA